MDRILVVSPHLDDETFGCGGTLIDVQINLIVVTKEGRNRDQLSAISNIYNGLSCIEFGFPDARLSQNYIPDMISKFSHYSQDPDIIYMPPNDTNTDHQVVHKACLSLIRILQPREAYIYEVIGSSNDNFKPNYYVPIDFEKKLNVLSVYSSEMRNGREVDRVRALAMVRGGEIRVPYAEAFQLVRGIRA